MSEACKTIRDAKRACPVEFEGKYGSTVGQSSSFGILRCVREPESRNSMHNMGRTSCTGQWKRSSTGHKAACASTGAVEQLSAVSRPSLRVQNQRWSRASTQQAAPTVTRSQTRARH